VAENLFMGSLGGKSPSAKPRFGGGWVDRRRIHHETREHLRRMEIDIDPKTRVSYLSLGKQQVLEIAKAMRSDPSILIFDEATSALATKEVEHVFELLRGLKARGVTILYVTHRMSEIFEIADTCTVLRGGRYVASCAMRDTSYRGVVDLMFGEAEVARKPARPDLANAATALRVKGLSRARVYSDVSFDVRRGEIVGDRRDSWVGTAGDFARNLRRRSRRRGDRRYRQRCRHGRFAYADEGPRRRLHA